MTATANQIAVLRQIASAVVETVRESGPEGAPGGVLYAAMMGAGCTLQQFEELMSVLVSANLLVKRGQLYFAA